MKKSKPTRGLGLVILTATLFLAACGTGPSPATADPSQTNGEWVQPSNGNGPAGGNSEVVFLLPSDVVNLDAHRTMDIISLELDRNIFSRLLKYDIDNNLAYDLAIGFEQIDPLTWVFELRRGITFHDGTPFNAEAAYLNFSRVLDPAFASPRLFVLDVISDVSVLGPYTIQLTTYFPFSPLPNTIAHSPHFISPTAIQEELDGGLTVGQNPVGTGAFMFASRTYGHEIRLVANPDFWLGAPYIDYLTYLVVPEAGTRLALLESGEAHAMQVSPTDAQVLEHIPGIDIQLIDSTRSIFLGFNNSRPPFDDVRLRQAVAYAIDLDVIIDGILEGFGLRGAGPVSPVIQAAPIDVVAKPYDMVRARELVLEADADGLVVSFYTNTGNPIQAMILEYVQAQLAQIGIVAELNLVEWGTFLEITAAGIPDMFVHGWSSTTGDADYGIFILFHSSIPGSGGNRFHTNNPALDAILDEARLITDVAARTALYNIAGQMLVDEANAVFLYYPIIPVATQGISGLSVDFNGTSNFQYVRLR